MSGFRNSLRQQIETRWYGQPGILRVLAPLSWLYEFIAERRKNSALARLQALSSSEHSQSQPPVVVVGNIVAGGTGKTPVVMHVVQCLLKLGAHPGVVARGYGGKSATWPRVVTPLADPQLCGDEPLELATRLGCPVVAGPDRSADVRWLVEFFGCDVIVSDDGLQHYGLQRSLELAVVDSARGQGNGRLLPVGPLREPASRLQSVDCLVKTARAGLLGEGLAGSDQLTDHVGSTVGSGRALVPELAGLLRPVSATHMLSNKTVALDQAPFVGGHCVALSAIGNPGRFHDDLAALGCTLTERVLADHSSYAGFVADWPDDCLVVTTGKDAVKLARRASDDVPDWLEQVWVLNRELVLSDADGETLNRLLQQCLTDGCRDGDREQADD